MEQSVKCSWIFLAIVFIAFNVCANPLSPNADADDSKLPPLIFPSENATIVVLPPMIFPSENATIGNGPPPVIFPSGNVTVGAGLPPVIFPSENSTIGNGPPPYIFPTENVTIGDGPRRVENKNVETAPLIFPETNASAPIVELPPVIFPVDVNVVQNQTAMEILNTLKKGKLTIVSKYTDDYYKEDSTEESDDSYDVEEVQAKDKSVQKDNLEENYKSDMHILPSNEYDDTEVDHPMLKNTHILGVIGAVLAVLCVCLYLGITVWRRIMFNRYGMRERLINEDDFYGNKSIHHNF